MASSQQASQTNCNHDARGGKRSRYLSRTIEQLARAGEQAGFSVEEMIEMLNAGVSIGALLDMISYSLFHEAREFNRAAVPPPPVRRCAYMSAGGIAMDCLECKNLEDAFESSRGQYNEARSAAYYRVSTELAAKKNVDMERARNDLEEHQLICASAKAQYE